MSTRVKEYGQTRSQLVVLLHIRDNHLINTQLNEFRVFHCGSERAKRTDALKKPQSQWIDNARCVTRTSGSDAATARVHSGDAADGSCLCVAPLQHLCEDSKLHCPTHSKVSVWDNTPPVTRRGSNMVVPNLSPDMIADGHRAS